MSKDKKLGEIPRGRPTDDKLLALRAYHRARGLSQRKPLYRCNALSYAAPRWLTAVIKSYAVAHFGISVDIVVRVGSLSDWLQHHQLMTDAIKLHLPHAKHRMKRRADSSKSLIGCF